MKAPAFWGEPDAMAGRLLAPLGWLYAQATARRLSHAKPWRPRVPVVCVGNLTAGGAGKTPVVRDLARRLNTDGKRPAILTRGYGGRTRGPLLVDPAIHDAEAVGDEPLLLARDAPCWVSADRALGAKAICRTDAEIILMDDGLQNPDLIQDLRLVVVDGDFGFGNRRPIPAGPLREWVAAGLARANALVVMGPDRRGLAQEFGESLPVLHAKLRPTDTAKLAGRRVVGFAGIGRPGKFRATLESAGSDVAAFTAFPDHHHFTETELAALAAAAKWADARLVTTEKDWVRLGQAWRGAVTPVPVTVDWDDEEQLMQLLDSINRYG